MEKWEINQEDCAFIDRVLEEERKKIEDQLSNYCEKQLTGTIGRASAYTIGAGGKRLRPILMVATYKSLGGKRKVIYPLSISVELIHSYSLIHDDLPQLDNDDYRRGKLTCHKVFGENTALLTGIDLIGRSVSVIISVGRESRLDVGIIQRLTQELMNASGVEGLVGGQVADILYESREFDETVLYYIHGHKTAVLFGVSTAMGSILAGSADDEVEIIRDYGMQLGFAFQIIDDILDETSSFEDMGKVVRKDHEKGKATFPSLFGVEGSLDKAREHAGKAREALSCAGLDDRFLSLFPLWILNNASIDV